MVGIEVEDLRVHVIPLAQELLALAGLRQLLELRHDGGDRRTAFVVGSSGSCALCNELGRERDREDRGREQSRSLHV
jgi:hypothetical protein